MPRGKSESNLFVRTFMLGARVAFAQLCKRASRIIVNKPSDKKLLAEAHGYPVKNIVVMETDDLDRVDWKTRVKELIKVYSDLMPKKKASPAKKKSTKK